jgi:hypothetical protein
MNAALPIRPESAPNGQKNNPENGRLRETPPQNPSESPQIFEIDLIVPTPVLGKVCQRSLKTSHEGSNENQPL